MFIVGHDITQTESLKLLFVNCIRYYLSWEPKVRTNIPSSSNNRYLAGGRLVNVRNSSVVLLNGIICYSKPDAV